MIKMRYGPAVEQEVLGELMRVTLYDAFKQQDIKPAGVPSIESTDYSEGKALQYTAHFEVYPEFTLVDLTGQALEVEEVELEETVIADVLARLQRQHADWQEVTRASIEGDRVTIDFVGTIDGQKFQGGEASDFEIILGDHGVIADVEKGLVGVQAGQKFTLPAKFPDNYFSQELRSQQAQFEIEVKRVEEAQSPSFGTTFRARWLGVVRGSAK